VVVNRFGSPALVLRNDASAPRVAVRLAGDAPNTRAVGAKIQLLGGAVPKQVHEVVAGGLYMSHSDYEASFAIGKTDAKRQSATSGRIASTRSVSPALRPAEPRPRLIQRNRCSRTRPVSSKAISTTKTRSTTGT